MFEVYRLSYRISSLSSVRAWWHNCLLWTPDENGISDVAQVTAYGSHLFLGECACGMSTCSGHEYVSLNPQP